MGAVRGTGGRRSVLPLQRPGQTVQDLRRVPRPQHRVILIGIVIQKSGQGLPLLRGELLKGFRALDKLTQLGKDLQPGVIRPEPGTLKIISTRRNGPQLFGFPDHGVMIVRGGEIASQKVLRAGELHLQMVVQLGQLALEDMIFVAFPVQQEEKVQESNKRSVFFGLFSHLCPAHKIQLPWLGPGQPAPRLPAGQFVLVVNEVDAEDDREEEGAGQQHPAV